MRPDPHHSYDRTDDSARIIHLGEVRRRRKGAAGRRLPDRHYLVALAVVAIVAWVVWITVLVTVPPSKVLTYLAFIVPLYGALASTGALLAYGLEVRFDPFPDLVRSVRRGILLALVAVSNLALLGAHRWSLPAFLVIAVAALLLELARTHRAR